MKVILIIGVVVSLLVSSTTAQVQIPAQRIEETFVLTPERNEKNKDGPLISHQARGETLKQLGASD